MRNAEIYQNAISRREALKDLLSGWRDRIYALADWEISPYGTSKWLIEALEAKLDEAELIVWEKSLFAASQEGAKSFFDYEFDPMDFPPPLFQHWQFYESGHGQMTAIEMGWEKKAGIPENAYCREIFIIPIQSERTGKYGICWANVYWPIVDSVPDSVRNQGIDSILPIFRFWAPIYKGDKTERPHHIFLAALGFMYSKVVSLEPVRAQRAERRRAHKLNKHLPTIQVTHLRQREYHSGDPGDPGVWSCRWIVRGHWRKQWYPKDGAHKPLFIEPHIKGPDGAPLKPPKEHMTVVAR